jgi:hypothetical protein
MRLRFTTSFTLLAVSLALTACGPSSSTNPTPDSGTGVPGAAFCARTRALNCAGASSCASTIDPVMVGIAPTCRTTWAAFVNCLDANAPTLTCDMIERGAPAACAAQFRAAEACGQMAGDSGSGASDAASDASAPNPPPAPSAGEWMSAVDYTLSGGNLMNSSNGQGNAFLAPGPTGSGADAYTLSFEWSSFLGAPGGDANCRVGLVYDRASSSYTFSGNSLLTQPCVVMPMAESATTLTFTGARVARNPVGGQLMVTLDVTGAGPRFNGSGRLEIAWPSP